MQYASSLPFSGNVDHAFRLAESALVALGFRIAERTPTSLRLAGPGMNSTRESALVGASQIQVHGTRGELTLNADLGGVERMARFVILFPLGLGLALALFFALTFGPAQGAALTAAGGYILLWMFVGPLMSRYIRARTCRGLDALLASMVTIGEAP